METFATGLKRIKDLCDEAGCKVEFRTEKDDFVVVFYRNLREEWNRTGDEARREHSVKTSDKKQAVKFQSIKSRTHADEIIDYLNAVGEAKTVDIAKKIGLSPVRTRVILANMPELEALGGNRNRTYRQKDNQK